MPISYFSIRSIKSLFFCRAKTRFYTVKPTDCNGSCGLSDVFVCIDRVAFFKSTSLCLVSLKLSRWARKEASSKSAGGRSSSFESSPTPTIISLYGSAALKCSIGDTGERHRRKRIIYANLIYLENQVFCSCPVSGIICKFSSFSCFLLSFSKAFHHNTPSWYCFSCCPAFLEQYIFRIQNVVYINTNHHFAVVSFDIEPIDNSPRTYLEQSRELFHVEHVYKAVDRRSD